MQTLALAGALSLCVSAQDKSKPAPPAKQEESKPAQVKDPVCGMTISTEDAFGTSEYKGKTYYFCSPRDKETFDKDPAKYAKPEAKK